MADGGAKVPMTENQISEPQCTCHWGRGTQQDYEPHQKTMLLVCYAEHRGRVRTILSSLSLDKIGPQEGIYCSPFHY